MRAGIAVSSLLLLSMTATAAHATSADVVVVVSSRTGAFGDALAAINRDLAGRALLIDISALGRQQAAVEIQASPAKVTLAVGPLASQVAYSAAPERPLVYCLLPNARRRGFNDKQNVRGVPLAVAPRELLSAVRSALPSARRVAALYDPGESEREIKRAKTDAKKAGLMLVPQPVASSAELSAAVERAFKRGDAVWLLPDRVVSSRESLRYNLLKSFEPQVPVIAAIEAQARQGAFMAVMPDPAAHGHAAAAMARAVADGVVLAEAAAPDTGVVTVINLRTATRMGLRVPDGALRTAGSVIK